MKIFLRALRRIKRNQATQMEPASTVAAGKSETTAKGPEKQAKAEKKAASKKAPAKKAAVKKAPAKKAAAKKAPAKKATQKNKPNKK
jgi:putative phosphoserine phosphatase/1-acylglycerol-3-phosphate O-acyltransferase